MSTVVSPEEAFGAGTSPDQLKALYPADLVDKLAQELSEEDNLLRNYVQKGRLEQWFPGIKRWAVEEAKRGLNGGGYVNGASAEEDDGDVEMAE
jgi:hypothetical protein